MIRVTMWNEFMHEKNNPAAIAVYPDGIHSTIKRFLEKDGDIAVTVATLDMDDHGLTDEVLDNTDVLVWWGHMMHDHVRDDIVAKVKRRILHGMGYIPLHSSHASKLFKSLMGTPGYLHWGDEQKEIVWNIMPSHPIMNGIPERFILEKEEIYGEPFGIPAPDELLTISWFEQGNVFRSGCIFKRGHGKIFYFQPGHESVPTYHNEIVQKVITNAVKWAAPNEGLATREFDQGGEYMARDTLLK